MLFFLSRFLVVLFLFYPGLLLSGDNAEFVSLGWSDNYNYYAFGQYGIEDGSGFPYAEIYIIDVEKNEFVNNGSFRKRVETDTTFLTGLSVLINLRQKADSLFDKYEISELRPGKVLFPGSNGQQKTASYSLNNGKELRLHLVQKSKGEIHEYTSESAFHLEIYSGEQPKSTIGNINRFRRGIIRYDINRVLSGPGEKNIVVVIQKQMLGFEGPSIRYMVETAKLD